MAFAGNPGHLLTLVYVSAAVHLLSEDEMLDLLRISRRNNQRAGITGVLLYDGGNFIQVLEGPEHPVRELLGRIKRDPRHSHYLQLLLQRSTERHFAHWSMGFKKMSDLSDDDRAAFNGYLGDKSEWLLAEEKGAPEAVKRRATAAQILLKSFKRSCGFVPEPVVCQLP